VRAVRYNLPHYKTKRLWRQS